MALNCREPKITSDLKQIYANWREQCSVICVGDYGFDDIIKKLEQQGFIVFDKENSTWKVTKKALDHIIKYYGGI